MVAESGIAPLIPPDACSYPRHMKADLLQCPGEQPVHLIAPATAAADDDLLIRRLWIEGQRTSELDVQVLVGNALEVEAMDRAQALEVDTRGALETDALEVARQVHSRACYGSCSPPQEILIGLPRTQGESR